MGDFASAPKLPGHRRRWNPQAARHGRRHWQARLCTGCKVFNASLPSPNPDFALLPPQAVEFAGGSARAVAGVPVHSPRGPNDWQPVIWRGLGFDYDTLLSSQQVEGFRNVHMHTCKLPAHPCDGHHPSCSTG